MFNKFIMNVSRWHRDVPSINEDTLALNGAIAAEHPNIHSANPPLSMYSKHLITPVKARFTFALYADSSEGGINHVFSMNYCCYILHIKYYTFLHIFRHVCYDLPYLLIV